VILLNWTVSETALNAEGEHVVARNLHDSTYGPAEASRTKKLLKCWIMVHLFSRKHVDLTDKPGVPIQ
jgi:hypothetical protein